MEWLAFFAGFRYFIYLRNRKGDPYGSDRRTWVVIGATLGALLGSRLVSAFEQPDELLRAPSLLLYIYSNKTIVGGLLGGLLGVELTKKIMGENRSSGDLFVYPLLLAMIIGRIGCFSMGVHEETYGLETRLPWGLDLGDGLRRHPVALYEIVFLILLWLGLRTIERRVILSPGALFKLFLITYLFFRLSLDWIKPRYGLLAGLSAIQIACLAGLLYYFPVFRQPQKQLTAHA